MTTRHFPDADEPDLQPFTQAFVRMMFAHAAFDHRVSDLLDTITGVDGFGERQWWSAEKRPNLMKKLIDEHHAGLPEANAVVTCLERSIPLCRTRNLLAHGSWWQFDVEAAEITVRSEKERPNEDRHRTFAVDDIQQAATSFDDLEAELFILQRAIEARPRPSG